MLSFNQYLIEGNLLQQRVNKHLSKGVSIGAVSPEGAHTQSKEAHDKAHADIKGHLDAARKAGHIGGWSGPHKGQYQYGGKDEVAKEGSYLVHAAGNKPEHHEKMVGALKKIGEKHKQESILSINKEKEGHWHHLSASSKSGDREYQGKVKYDKPLSHETGRTEMKKGGHSFTTVK